MAELPVTLVGLQRELARGRLSAAEALAIQRRRLPGLDDGLNSVVSVPDGEAAAVRATGPLAGIGLAHKDIFDTAGFRPGLGHDRGAPDPSRRAAPAIAALAGRGAAHLARLAMAEYACGATGANPRLPSCRNPLRPEAMVGGSSSGSAVAVAAGIAYGSLGTDTGGSVRIPAATCGLVGLKTTHGLVSRDGVFPLAPALDSVGILARTAADAGALLAAVAARPLPAAHESGSADADLASLRIKAVLPSDLDAQVADALQRFAATWPKAAVVDALAEQRRLSELAQALMAAESACTHRDALIAGQASSAVEAVALPGLAIRPEWADAVRAVRSARLRDFVAAHLTDHDLLLLPALSHPVPDWAQVTPEDPAYDSRRHLGLFRHMGFVNYLGLPSVVFPVAADARGLPIAVQVLARPFHDALLLDWAGFADRRLHDGQGFAPAAH